MSSTLSGHTLTVAEKLQEALSADGHAVSLAQVETVGPAKLSAEDAALQTRPAIDAYEGLVLCTPVRGGTVPSPMARYLRVLTQC